MKTTFTNCLKLVGLSQREAATFLGLSETQVKDRCRNKTHPRIEEFNLLASLFAQQQDAAEGALEVMTDEGIDIRSLNHISADAGSEPLPLEQTAEMAGAMALLMAIDEGLCIKA